MKRIILMMLFLSVSIYSQAQSASDIYLVGTSIQGTGQEQGVLTGFYKFIFEGSPIFIIGSAEKGFDVWLDHTSKNNITGDETVKRVSRAPIDYINNTYNTVINIDEFIRTKTQEEVWSWMLANYEKTVWIIDKNDFFKSSPDKPHNDRMKLIEVRISIDNIPDEVLNPF